MLLAAVGPASAETIVSVDQRWSAAKKTTWYTLSQGARLVPLVWLKALEQPDSNQLFLDAANIEKFRYLPNSQPGKTGMPVGFAIDQQDDDEFSHTKLRWKDEQADDEPWVGMNCAACHTNEITYQGKRMRIEGAPTLADFQGFMQSLNRALKNTKDDAEKFSRFADKVLKDQEDSSSNRNLLKQALTNLVAWQQKVENANKTPLQYGFGRLDAFGHIFNKVAISVERDGGARTYHASNAPVSYPFLWNVPQHDKVQWNGFVRNQRLRGFDVGALARNIGEVTGVFADVKWYENDVGRPVVISSARAANLSKLESLLNSLRAPLWPTSVFGTIHDAKRDHGRRLFIDNKRKYANGTPIKACSECHKGLPRHNLHLPIDAKMTPLKDIGTDIWMACNAVTHQTSTGFLLNSPKPGGGTYLERAPTSSLVTTTITSTVFENLGTVLRGLTGSFGVSMVQGLGSTTDAGTTVPALLQPIRSTADQERRNQCLNGTSEFLRYKGRPLTGIWATAPYLHNGSVPTLYDLLLPPEQRPTWFAVGSREFDKKRVGYVTRVSDDDNAALVEPSGDNSFKFETRDAGGRIIDGNSNLGHDYGNALLTPEERWALVEYMKGL